MIYFIIIFMKNEIPQFSLNINKIFNKKFENKNRNLNSTIVQPKFNAQSKFGNEILIIDDINNKANEAQKVFDIYPSFTGSTKNTLCLSFLSENRLQLGSKDNSLKILEITNKICDNTKSGNFQRFDSILPFQNNDN